MYADNLALIAEFPQELQAMLNIVHSYALLCREMETQLKCNSIIHHGLWSSRTQARSLREWHLRSEEADEVHHPGIL